MNSNENKLMTSEFFSLLLNNTDEGITAFDKHMKIIFVNRRCFEIHGIPEGTAPEAWKDYVQVFEPDGVTPTPDDKFPVVRALKGETILSSYNVLVINGRAPALVKYNAKPWSILDT